MSHPTHSTAATQTTQTQTTTQTQQETVCPSCHYEATRVRRVPAGAREQTCARHVAAYQAEIRQRAAARELAAAGDDAGDDDDDDEHTLRTVTTPQTTGEK